MTDRAVQRLLAKLKRLEGQVEKQAETITRLRRNAHQRQRFIAMLQDQLKQARG